MKVSQNAINYRKEARSRSVLDNYSTPQAPRNNLQGLYTKNIGLNNEINDSLRDY